MGCWSGRAARLFRRKRKKANPIRNNATNATPTTMPACAPQERPLGTGVGLVDDEEEVAVAAAGETGLEEG